MSEGNSIVNFGDLSKPATVLIEKVSNAVGVLYEPRRIKKKAEAEAEAEKIKALASIELSDIQQRAIDRMVQQEGRKQENIEAISGYICDFMKSRGISLENMHGLGLDCTNTMSGHRSGVQKRLRLHAPSALYIHCRCHQLQLAAIYAAEEHVVVKRVLGTLLAIW